MKVVEITAMHSKRNISVLNTFVFTDKDVLETRKKIRKASKQVKGLEHYQAMCKSALDKVREETRRQELNM